MVHTATQLNYHRSGPTTSSTIVFLHGFCEDLTMWNLVLEKGFSNYNCLCVDLPGFGQSPITENISLREMGNSVIHLLDDLAIDNFILFGHSMGGYVNLSIAANNPERIIGFGLINSHPFADSDEMKANRQKSIDFINTHGSSLYIKQLIPNLFPMSFVRSNRFLIEQITFLANDFPDMAISNAQRAMIERSDLSEVLTQLDIPILHLIGELDTLLPLDKLIQQSEFPSIAQIEIINGVGHMSPFEKPAAVRNIILNYLSNLSVFN